MADHRAAVQELKRYINEEHQANGLSTGRETTSSLEILAGPEIDNADALLDEIKQSFDSPACTVSARSGRLTVHVQFDRQGTHVIHTGMDPFDAVGVLLRSGASWIPSASLLLKLLAIVVIVVAVRYRELLVRELEWRAATLGGDAA